MSLLALKDLEVAYGENVVLKNLNLDIEQGELVSLLGPSGCGKTTTLRVMAGFMPVKSGQFIFNGKDYTKVPVHQRNFGFVFQSYALFPHMNIADNVRFGLKLRKVDSKETDRRVMEILEIVDLKDFAKRFPKELSGGQQQRVALARALVIKPDLLLFDEPLSNLDVKLRVKMRVEIRKIQQALKITAVYVTHDQEECFSISDKVAVMNHGVIEQMDSPQHIFRAPATEFVSKFVGFENFIELEHVSDDATQSHYLAKSGESFTVPKNRIVKTASHCRGGIRPDDVIIRDRGDGLANNVLEGTIGISTYLGKQYQYVVDTKLGPLLVNSSAETVYRQGDTVLLHLPGEKIILV